MKRFFLTFLLLFIFTKSEAAYKKSIIVKLKDINNVSFNFEQNINGKIENGKCTIEYPKKIFCLYDLSNEKMLVSNGRSLVVKTNSSYYIYPIKNTPLNFILDKNFLIKKIEKLDERLIGDKFVNFNFSESDSEFNIFFDTKTHNLIGWQTLDIYQNLSITYISSIIKNQNLKENLFSLPKQD